MFKKYSQTTDYKFEIFKKFSSHDVYPEAEKWLEILRSTNGVIKAEITGDLRRGKSIIDALEIAAATRDAETVITSILGIDGFTEVLRTTQDSTILLLISGIELIIWFTKPERFGSLLQYTTGSNAYNNWVKHKAESLGLNYEEGMLDSGDTRQEFGSEASLYAMLGLPVHPPELREVIDDLYPSNTQFSSNLITHSDIRSDLHVHSNFSDGKNSIEEMVCGALIRNLSCLAITDHSPSLLTKRYKDDSYFLEQHLVIDQLRKKCGAQISILKGIEADIFPNGEIDLSDTLGKKMDIVVASLHVDLDQGREEITQRLIRAIENPLVDIIGHPGGRLFPMADITDLDWERIFRAAAYKKVALEINSHKSHPLFDDEKVRMAVAMGVPIALNSDSHSTAMLDQSRFGISIARRAGLSSEQVMNTWSSNHLKLWLMNRRKAT